MPAFHEFQTLVPMLKMQGSMKSHKKEMNAGAIQSLVRILVPKAHPCPAPVVDAAFQQLTGLASRQSSTGSILMQQHVQGLLEPLQVRGLGNPGQTRRVHHADVVPGPDPSRLCLRTLASRSRDPFAGAEEVLVVLEDTTPTALQHIAWLGLCCLRLQSCPMAGPSS